MRKSILSFLLLLTLSVMSHLRAQITTGAAQFDKYIPLLQGKRVGVTANHTSLINGVHLIDELLRRKVNIVRIYAPEHGFAGKADAGAYIATGKDTTTGLEIVSMYGKNRKPTRAQLHGIDCMLFDMQDVGLRFFTYLSTLHYVMEACAEQGIPLIILDRPNPNGHYVDGPLLEAKHRSFVGMHPVPIVHGMTLGEMAGMINGEQWLDNGIQCSITVITCTGYTHHTPYEPPVRPSPNLPNLQAIYLYASLCFFEGTTISVGRGTAFPFQAFGHPAFRGVYDFSFTPESVEGASSPPWKGEACYGVDLRNFPREQLVRDGRIRIEWLMEAYRNFTPKDTFFLPYFAALWGTSRVRQLMERGATADEIRNTWTDEVNAFKLKRAGYLLYED